MLDLYATTAPPTAASTSTSSSTQQPLLDLKHALPDHVTYGAIKVVGAAVSCGVLSPGWTPPPSQLRVPPVQLSPSTPSATASASAPAATPPFSVPTVPTVPTPPRLSAKAASPSTAAAAPASTEPSSYEAEDRSEWHAARKKGLGGSDIAAVMGVSPWQTPMDVWLSKTGKVGPNAETVSAVRLHACIIVSLQHTHTHTHKLSRRVFMAVAASRASFVRREDVVAKRAEESLGLSLRWLVRERAVCAL